MHDDDQEYRSWWERVWQEREDLLQEHFGISHPPGSPEGYVASFVTCGGEARLLIPGACALICPPRGSGIKVPHRNWLYIGHGLTQPRGPEERPEPPHHFSGFGAEFAILTPRHSEWSADLISFLMGYGPGADPPLDAGHRLPFGFAAHSWFVGKPDHHRVDPVDDTRAMIFWPLLGAPRKFTTSTGSFDLLVGTSITGDEWGFAKRTSSAHLLLLLVEAGVGQASIVGRSSVLAGTENASRIASIGELSDYDVFERLSLAQAHCPL